MKADQPTILLAADGTQLAMFRRTNREQVKLADVSPHVVEALLATEDRRFHEHRGLDIRRTVAAAWHTMRGDLQGGSTITQQLARNLFPEEIGRAPTIERKVKEAITALKIESVYSKDQILEMYLNTVPFLYNTYGIEMAARTYFDRSAGNLDVLQAATLIGMLKGTTYYNPVLNPERARQRRNIVLAQLAETGRLDAARLESLKKAPLGLDFERQQEEDLGPAPHLAQHLRRWLVDWADRRGYNMHADGLVVRTTIDSRLQQLAIEAVTRQADRLQLLADKAHARPNRQLVQLLLRETPEFQAAVKAGSSPAEALKKLESDPAFMRAFWRGKTMLQAAFLAQDPASGHVKAWVGSRGYEQDQFDHVQQARRQPGSTFKPFVYGAAFAMGMQPAESFIDEPMEFRIDHRTVWKPTDMSGSSGLPMTLRDGLAYSKNTITAQLVQRVGPARVAQLAHALGVRQSRLEAVPSLALGTSPVTLKEMVSAYSSIASGGTYLEPVLVLRIENRKGEVLEEFAPPAREQAMDLVAANTLLDVMRAAVDRGTGAPLRSRFGLQGDLAGKTGTTQDYTDGWFVLMHPQLVTGAWVGFNDARITMADPWGQGGRSALLLVGDFMQGATRAKFLDTKAKFNAPRLPEIPAFDPTVVAQQNEAWNRAWQSAQDPQSSPQPGVVVIDPSWGADEAPSRPQRARPEPPPERITNTPDFTGAPQRRDGPPQVIVRRPSGAPDGRPEYVWRPGGAEMGGPPAPPSGDAYPPPPAYPPPSAYPPPPPPSGGIRILRSY